jgi:hypothetical protein
VGIGLPSLSDLLAMSNGQMPGGQYGPPDPSQAPPPPPQPLMGLGGGAPMPDAGFDANRLYTPQHYDPNAGGASWPYPHVPVAQGFGDYLALGLQGLPAAGPHISGSSHPGPGGFEQFLSGLAHGYSNVRTAKMGEREQLNAALADKAKNENAANLEATKQATAAKLALGNEQSMAAWHNAHPPSPAVKAIDMSDVMALPGTLNAGDIGKLWTDPSVVSRVSGKTPTKPASTDDLAPNLTPAGLDAAAIMYAKTGQMVPMGMGKAGVALRTKVINRAAELMPGLDIASNKAGFTSDQGSLTAMQKIYDASTAFEGTALKNAQVLMDAMKRIPNTSSPLFNKPIRSISRAALGSVEMAAYDVARQTVIPEFTRVLSSPGMSGQFTEGEQKQVDKVISGDYSINQMQAVIATLAKDAHNRTSSYANQIDSIRTRIKTGGGIGQEAALGTAAASPAVPATGKMTGTKVLMKDPNGNPFMVDQAEADDAVAHGWSMASPVSAHARSRK